MKKLEFEGYEVYSTDGYSHSHVAYFTSRSDAERVVGKDYYKGVSETKKSLIVFESYDEYLAYQADWKRRAALAKLSAEEKKLLGLGEE